MRSSPHKTRRILSLHCHPAPKAQHRGSKEASDEGQENNKAGQNINYMRKVLHGIKGFMLRHVASSTAAIIFSRSSSAIWIRAKVSVMPKQSKVPEILFLSSENGRIGEGNKTLYRLLPPGLTCPSNPVFPGTPSSSERDDRSVLQSELGLKFIVPAQRVRV